MKIENNGVNPLTSKPTDGAHPVEKNNRATESTSSAGSKDRATLSERAKDLSKARTALEEVSDVRSEKVESVKEKIEKGTYEIPYEALAKTLADRLGLD
jgi:negative regulator of flagellin synthesis FlgM